jgi:threonine/homoserine/homoserine lactone efflux protein
VRRFDSEVTPQVGKFYTPARCDTHHLCSSQRLCDNETVVPLDTLLPFIAFSLVIIAIPGPSVMFAISRALVLGRRGAIITVVGNGIGVFVQAVAVSVGLGVLIESNDTLMTVIRLAGAGFLIYLGINSLRHRRDGIAGSEEIRSQPSRNLLRESIVVGLSNPKTIVFFSAVFPQFVDPSRGPIVVQMLILSVVFVAFGISGDAIYAVSAGAARDWFAQSPQRIVTIRVIGGVLILGLGITTALLP